MLVLGIGNILMGDEGVGVVAVRELARRELPRGVTCLDGGTGSFQLLGPLQEADRVILIDATADGCQPGTIERLRPQFSQDYPRRLTAHDIGLKDLLDAFYLLGRVPAVILFTVSIDWPQEIGLGLSRAVRLSVPAVVERVLAEIEGLSPSDAPTTPRRRRRGEAQRRQGTSGRPIPRPHSEIRGRNERRPGELQLVQALARS